MSVKPELAITADGSHTLFVSGLDEHYHSVNGAVQESMHVFIDAGFRHCSKQEIYIFEVGFGTGLNAFLTLQEALKSEKTIHYISIEAFPLDNSIIGNLNYTKGYTADMQKLYLKLHEAEWGREVQITDGFFLTKIEADFTSFDFSTIGTNVDLIYFDAFAPDKQPDMWAQDIFDQLSEITNDDGILVTYCAKGVVRRMMQQSGYTTERIPGPPGKREMLRARKPMA